MSSAPVDEAPSGYIPPAVTCPKTVRLSRLPPQLANLRLGRTDHPLAEVSD
jgi:hypothetical protein